MDDDEVNWNQTVQRFNLSTNGLINYRIGSKSQLAKTFGIKDAPAFVLLARSGQIFDQHAKRTSDPLLVQEFNSLLAQKQ